MASLTTSTYLRKKPTGFADVTRFDKHERLARQSLHSLIVFSHVLKKEIRVMEGNARKGIEIDHELLDKMSLAKQKYEYAMNGFMELDEMQQRHALIIFADAVQDLMTYMHHRKGH